MKNDLPFIYIPEINAKFLLDTGSSRSLINSKLAYKYYSHFIQQENFQIQTSHDTSFHDKVTVIPIFKIFKVNDTHKFYIFDFNKKYDGLIGIDLLQQLHAVVDIGNKVLVTQLVQIPILIHENKTPQKQLRNCNHTIIIPPRTQQIVKIPVCYKNGIGILNFTKYSKDVESPEAVINIENYFAYVALTNSGENSYKITITEPFDIELLNTNEVNFCNQLEPNNEIGQVYDKLLKENLKNLQFEHLNSEEKKAIQKICFEYRDIFHCEDIPLSFSNEITHKINLTNDSPIYTKSYRFPEIHKKEVASQISKMLDQGIIQPSTSPWNSPIWIVPKKLDHSGKQKWRIVIDYRKLNERTIDDKYPLPNITDILDKLGRANYFTTLDLASGFHQIEIDKNDIQKTGFSTQNGHYEFKRMPFGLKNAPSTFQRVMDNILRGLNNEICLVYLDDIIIFSTSLQEHICRLKSVFDRLRKANFKIQLDKSNFLQKEVAYLGHVITPQGVRPNPDKISAIQKFPIPTTQKEIKSFLGLLGYYRRFIKDFAKITKPLTACLKKNAKIIHNQNFVESFNNCKQILCNDPILQYPDFEKEFILTTDASNVAIGAILSQGTIGSDKPVAYASRTLNETEQRYSTIEKELLAIVWACKYFRPYIFGRRFVVVSDHRPLSYLFNLKEPNSKLIRWRLKLEEYDYTVVYKKGKLNSNADALSRIKINLHETESTINNPGDVNQETLEFLNEFANNPENYEPLPSTSNDGLTQPKIIIHSDIQIKPPNKPCDSDQTPHSLSKNTSNDAIPIQDEIINNKTNQILIFKNNTHKLSVDQEKYGNQKILTVKLPITENEKLIFNFMKEYLKPDVTYYIYFCEPQFSVTFSNIYSDNFNKNGFKLIRCTKLINTVKDIEEQLCLIRNHHEGKTNHRGIEETLQFLKRNYYWLNMKDTITRYINSCNVCQRAKYSRKLPYVPLMLTETPSKPFQIVHIDVFTYDSKIYLTIVDAFSKFAQIHPLAGKTAIHISDALVKHFAYFGTPQNIVIDSGREFCNETVKELLKLHKINVHFTTPGHHESNSIVERFHSTLIEHLRILKELYPQETDLTNYAILGYNNSIHTSTGFTPFEIVFGHTNARNPDEIFHPKEFFTDYVQNHKDKVTHMYDKIKEKIQTQKEKIVAKLNVSGDNSDEFKLGQKVFKKKLFTRNKKDNKFVGPYIVKKLLEHNKVEIQKIAGKNKNKSEIVHIKELKKPPLLLQAQNEDSENPDLFINPDTPGPSSGN